MSQPRSTINYLNMPSEQALLLKKLNGSFLAQHDKTALSSLNSIDTVVTFSNGHLTLHKKDEKQNAYIKIADEIVAPDFGPYTQIKEISHIPLLILETLHDNQLSVEQKNIKLQSIAQDLKAIYSSIPGTNQVNAKQKEILAHSIHLLTAMTNKPHTKLELDHFFQMYMEKIKPAIEFNTNFVAQIQLQSLHRIMAQWGHTHRLNLDKTRVMIVAAHGPREGLIEMQYFLDLYRKLGISNAENNKVYMVEQLPQHFGSIKIEKDLIEHFLAVSERNKVIGQVFKNDQQFMFKDVLADKAPPALAKLSDASKNCMFFKPKSACPVMQKLDAATFRSRL